MEAKVKTAIILFVVIIPMLNGCVSTNPHSKETVAPVLTTNGPTTCGLLDQFVIDVNNFDSGQQEGLRHDLVAENGQEYFCDRLKIGLALSQVGKTVEEDTLALQILREYQHSDKLSKSERKLIALLIPQCEERKRLHILLHKLSTQLVAEKSLSETKTTEVLELQLKLNQLQKLETDINETEQSISPATTGPSKQTSEDTDS